MPHLPADWTVHARTRSDGAGGSPNTSYLVCRRNLSLEQRKATPSNPPILPRLLGLRSWLDLSGILAGPIFAIFRSLITPEARGLLLRNVLRHTIFLYDVS